MKTEESAQTFAVTPAPATIERARVAAAQGKIWIDLDNTPNVPFFAPIVEELEKRRCSVVLTARDGLQVRQLADLYHLKYRLVGRHSGKNNVRKMAGLCFRGLQLIPLILKEKPDLAVSVCSRSQLIVSTLLGIPSLLMGDYEFAKGWWAFIHPMWKVCPEVIPNAAIPLDPTRILKYPGIKEDVYVPRFVPDPSIRSQLGLQEQDVVATLRPPASAAHYHNQQTDDLFAATVQFLGTSCDVRLVALPRDDKQAAELRKRWPDLFLKGTMRIPDRVVNGLNLIWHSDFVISAGGTMNREAAALGVPVYSVFRGRIGSVDQYLARQGRLVLLESAEDVRAKIVIARRNRPERPEKRAEAVLRCVIERIIAVIDAEKRSGSHRKGVGLNSLTSVAGKRDAEFSSSELAK